jgi:two-component system chemotaxis response regulator CheB
MTDLGHPIRVLVAEDSAPIRDLLVHLLDGDGRFRVVATAGDGHEVADLAARLRPDVIAMNMLLPRLDGIGATRRIMAEAPTPIVIISTAGDATPTELAVEAMQAGAVTVLDKPLRPGDPRHAQAVQELLTAIRLMAEVKVVRRPTSGATKLRERTGVLSGADTSTTSKRRPIVVSLAASTGGPQAIQTVLQALGPDLHVPVLVVQHMSPGFLKGMVAWLGATCPQVVRLAVHGEEPAGGTVSIAPEDHHLLVTRSGKLALTRAPAVGGFRPSANTLFESVAECYGSAALGAVLTGMGEDGAAGLAALRSAGASTIAQDEASAVVYGMPRAAAAVGAAERVLPLGAIGPTVRKLLGLKSRLNLADSKADW